MPNEQLMHDFAHRLIVWQRRHGRSDLPWQGTQDPYRIWLSEIMLQQTQVATVIPYYLRFLRRFPDVASLASASEDEVMTLWAGLGYYSRARNLHRASRVITDQLQGRFPREQAALEALPGVGRSTAAAIAAFAYGKPGAILDGNVKRVLTRIFGITGWPGEKAVEARLWSLAESLLPDQGIAAYTQGLMDLGATICTRRGPLCGACPFLGNCHAERHGLQEMLPTSRPGRSLPERATAMLMLCWHGHVLLEKRPSPGIWGGLWSLPECAPGIDPAAEAFRLGYTALQVNARDGLNHTFTHFRLHIQPWLILVDERPRVEAPGRRWQSLAEIDALGVPAPVQRLLRGVATS